MTQTCPNCKVSLKDEVVVEEMLHYSCPSCSYSKLEPSSKRAVRETPQSPLQLKQRITTLSQGRLGLYLNQDVVRSLGLRAGQEVYVSVPDSKQILILISTIK